MPRIPGEFEFPDGTTPGHSKDGGMSGLVYDDDGKLVGHGSFHPDDENDEDDDELNYEEVSDVNELKDKALHFGLGVLVAYVAGRIWHLTKARRQERGEARSEEASDAIQCSACADDQAEAISPEVITPREWSLNASDLARGPRTMSRDEALRRLLFALAAKAVSDEQFEILANARIDGYEPDAQAEIASWKSASLTEVTLILNKMLESGMPDVDTLGQFSIADLLSGGAFVNGEYVPVSEVMVGELLQAADENDPKPT